MEHDGNGAERARRWHIRCSTRGVLTPRRLFVASFVTWCACIALGWAMACPLGGDEAAYALLARGGGDGWLYRPIGMVAFARIGALLGDSELALRLPSMLVALTLVPAVYAVGRRIGPWCGAWAAAVVAGTHTFVVRGPQLLTDIPSAICILVAISIVIDELDREDGPRYRLVWVAPVLAVAFHIRYGSAPTIAILAIAAAALWRRSIARRPGPVIATALVFVVLLVPFLIYSQRMTGSITGIVALSSEVAGRRYIGHGLVIYLVSNPLVYHGALVTPLVLAGIASVFRPPPAHRRRAQFLASVGLGQFFVIGLVSHANARFIFVAIVLLVVLGVDAFDRALAASRHRGRALEVAGLAVGVLWIGMLAAVVPIHRKIHHGLAELVAASRAIRTDAAGRPCIVIARATPQVMWYSGCASSKPPKGFGVVAPLPADHRWYTASTPRRGTEPEKVGGLVDAEPVLLAPGAWYLRPRN